MSNNRNRSSSLSPLRQSQVRASALPSTESPIMEPVVDIINLESMNERISNLEGLIRSLISNLPNNPIESNVTVTTTSTTPVDLGADVTELTITPTRIETRHVSKKNYTQTSTSVKETFSANRIDMNCKDSLSESA